ncbi:LysR family transcriptional regulator [Rhodococcus sp. IEGM 1379]|uniref:LysR family transcriptional regulator n=1 Tax=Rhodococcus sp. IEGM 1379 TaxID=3047086 RepID=UPI0024B7F861|nr:LysR family transcriptional regulator [Rhodococcus sp. IEGM 1379]MDI9917307.1 LysR family transcriptional regulator [Rhodococcus sp. IEGM 1379]
MNQITLRQLRYLVAVADAGSLAAAGDELFVSQTAVSLSLTQLESELGAPLAIRRKSKGSVLTAAGVAVAARARRILADTDELAGVVGELQGELTGSLRMGCYGAYSPRIMPAVIEHFAQEHPRVTVTVTEGSSTELQASLLEGKLDACLILQGHLQADIASSLIVRVIPKVLLSANHPLAAEARVSFEDLDGLPAVLSSVKPSGTLVESMIRSMGFQPDVRWRSSNTETIRSMVGRGLAYSVLLSMWPGPTTQEGFPLVLKDITETVPENAFVMAYPEGTQPSRKLEELLTFCRSAFDPF